MAQNQQLALLGQSVTVDSNGNPTFSGTPVPNSSFLRNRIINGDMRIDQRNAGASVSISTNDTSYFPVDRCIIRKNSSATITAQQSATAPTGFKNSTLITVSSGSAVGAGNYFIVGQNIEGFNVADLGFGTASAATITISFWARSSLTGTYNFLLSNNTDNRSYVTTFTINAANTFEYKTITIAGDTAGTWTTDNTSGLKADIVLGAGTTYQVSANTWTASPAIGTSSATNTFLTAANTFYLTGFQLEVGTAATPFERRQYGQELALCQRYFEKSYNLDVAPGAVTTLGAPRQRVVSTDFWWSVAFKVAKRTDATCVVYSNRISNSSGNLYQVDGTGSPTDRAVTLSSQSQTGYHMYSSTIGAVGSLVEWQWTASAEL